LIYNLLPILKKISDDHPNAENWRTKIKTWFSTDYDKELQDLYYNLLVHNHTMLDRYLNQGYMVDEYTGLFTFEDSEGTPSFSTAYWIEKNHQMFFNKRVFTVCADYGIMNIQLKFCGIKVVNSYIPLPLVYGAMLITILNDCPPYPMNLKAIDDCDVVITGSIFGTDDAAYNNWNMLLDMRAIGKDVFFSTNNFSFLKKYFLEERIQKVQESLDIYQPEDYSNLRFAYDHRVYRIT
jgi:hypothetical protein